MGDLPSQPPDGRSGRKPVVVGVLAAPGLASDIGEQLSPHLPTELARRFPEVSWQFEVVTEPLVGAVGFGVDVVQVARRRLLEQGWNFAICLTDLPLHVGRRPVTAYASATLGVGVVSVPALGAVAVEGRVREAVVRLLDGLLAESVTSRKRGADARRRRRRMRRRLRELASPVGHAEIEDDRTVRFVTTVGPGNLRLLIGMVRTNRPWRLVVGLSRTLVAAFGTAAFGLTSPGVWRIADGMGVPRQLTLLLGSVVVTCITLIVVHGLWEHSPSRQARDQVMLFNLATALTIALGVLTLYLALLAISTLCGVALIAPTVLGGELRHPVGVSDYLQLAWLVGALATIGSALGAAVENDVVVREAAYGYRPQDRSEEIRQHDTPSPDR